MYIVELNGEKGEEESVEKHISGGDQSVVVFNTKRVLVGAGARALFYPTLLYNVVRNKIQSEFHWWDRVDEVWKQLDIPVIVMLLFLSCIFERTIFWYLEISVYKLDYWLFSWKFIPIVFTSLPILLNRCTKVYNVWWIAGKSILGDH